MDPLIRMKEAHLNGLIPDDVYNLVVERFPVTVDGINRIEKASGIRYPTAYVEPSIIISTPHPNSYEFGILFARTIPVFFDDKFHVVIQISAPLVAYGLKGTIHAILAHEFLHFLELMRKISKMDLLSELAVDSQIKQRKVPQSATNLQAHANGPDFISLQGWLLACDLALVPWDSA